MWLGDRPDRRKEGVEFLMKVIVVGEVVVTALGTDTTGKNKVAQISVDPPIENLHVRLVFQVGLTNG